ncbi:MAG: c-type cytochrome biogenesis protein CcsB [Methylibium sp.]|uniref:c-type cytochrome biogenesis protein CcsB n=1 Tax=Methylibium sp. TaxID=2067992 RepID=UPI001850163D|nr:c-type cytochrome biogenesis protein CcsB [Methylibium sp.]MBA3598355.1 c-type cytochrome biogenesis protein CcsB [Methylibium sp.]
MNTTTQSTPLLLGQPGYFVRRTALDWLFALLVVVGAGYAFSRYGAHMDGYEKGILAGAVPSLIGLGWFWAPLRALTIAVALASFLAIGLYSGTSDGFGADLEAGQQLFLLKYLFASQTAILWMSVLFFMSTLFYWLGFFQKSGAAGAERIGSVLAWGAVFMGLVGTMVRWYESHQIGEGIGHIPVSNLYEVFVLFAWMTTLFYLYFEAHYLERAKGRSAGQADMGEASVRSLGAFVMLIVSCSVGFLIWYTLARDAQQIQPLVPALQSWWMKVHVPANFVGYGTFALAAMVAWAYLLKTASTRALLIAFVGVPLGLLAALAAFANFGGLPAETVTTLGKTMRMVGGAGLFFALTLALRRPITARLPSLELLDDVMYKAIAVGFAFFTIATVLGALWAAEAWGGYWSWDPKETWALIVWLNYAAWLHMRLMKGLRGTVASWWALVGLAVTTFAFIGVNMFLSGLHSYGEL